MTKSKRKLVGGFLALPKAVLHSSKFRQLSANAVKLLVDIGSQYDGKNNGDLAAAWKIMRLKGWRSEATLQRGKKELLDAGFIDETRKGHLPNKCSLYGLTFHPLNANPKFDVGAVQRFAFGAWASPTPA